MLDGKNATYRSIRVGRSNRNSELNIGRVISAKERHEAILNNVLNQTKNSSIALNSKLMAGMIPLGNDLTVDTEGASLNAMTNIGKPIP